MFIEFHGVVCDPVHNQQLYLEQHESFLRSELFARFYLKKQKIPLEAGMLLPL